MTQDHCTNEVQRDLGRMEGQIKSLEERVAFLNSEIQQVHIELRNITTILSEAKGSWKTMVMLGGFAAAVGAALFKMFEVLGGHAK